MGNPITNELPASLDNFLHDMCQMYCNMTYMDASKFAKRATPEDIKALRNLYRKFREAAKYDDEDEIAEIAVSVEDLVKGKGLEESSESDYDEEWDPFETEKKDNPYILGNCSLCGAKGTDTVENFLKKYGFKNIEYCCDVLDIDPFEEVCKECFKSWLPDLNKALKESVKKGGKRSLKESHEWSDFDKFKNTDEYLPSFGDGDNKGTQAATALSKLIYKWFNDGDVFDTNYGLRGWANDISGSANWLYYNVPETQPILNRIKEIGSDEDAYTDLLYDLVALVDPQIPTLATFPKEGDAYDEDGPFSFREVMECPECGCEIDEDEYNRYGMCRDCYERQYEEDEEDYEEDVSESAKLNRRRLSEAGRSLKITKVVAIPKFVTEVGKETIWVTAELNGTPVAFPFHCNGFGTYDCNECIVNYKMTSYGEIDPFKGDRVSGLIDVSNHRSYFLHFGENVWKLMPKENQKDFSFTGRYYSTKPVVQEVKDLLIEADTQNLFTDKFKAAIGLSTEV